MAGIDLSSLTYCWVGDEAWSSEGVGGDARGSCCGGVSQCQSNLSDRELQLSKRAHCVVGSRLTAPEERRFAGAALT